MFVDPAGPIERFEWGMFVVGAQRHGRDAEGRAGAGKDIRLIGTTVSRWKEREGHRLTLEMITGVYEQGVEVLVIGIGVDGLIVVPEKVQQGIEEHGISTLILQRTPEACRTYNRLHHERRRVALLAHGTC